MPSRLLFLALMFAARLGAESLPGPALPLFDAYLAESARSVTAYRADIRIGEDPRDAGPGRLFGESAFLGRFSFRPVTYAELSRTERALLVHDPQFRAFLQRRIRLAPNREDRPAASSADPIDFHVAIAPKEMLRREPFDIVLRP